jgi:hypothetical protein
MSKPKEPITMQDIEEAAEKAAARVAQWPKWKRDIQNPVAPELCPACKSRPKDWEGSNPKCGFLEGVFSTENWNCATLNVLRDAIEDRNSREYCGDQSCVTLPLSDCGEFLVVTWYKNRGCTEGCFVIDGAQMRKATLKDVGAAFETLEQDAREKAFEKDRLMENK